MAKRGVSKPKKPKAKNNAPLSDRARKNLTKALKNARERVRNLQNKYGASYIGPSPSDFHLSNILDKLTNGVHINTIYAMIRNATAKNYEKQTQKSRERRDPIVANLYGGAPVRQSQYSRLLNAIAKANKNIDAARNNPANADILDILPSPLMPDEVLSKLTSTKRLDETINVINDAFKKGNFVLTAVSETGEAATAAEIMYLNSFITNENLKRSDARLDTFNILEKTGRFKTNQEFSLQDVDTSTWDNIEKWRNRTEYFTDARALDKASRWMQNYLHSFLTLRDTGNLLGVFEQYPELNDTYDRILGYLSRINTEDLVRAVTRFSEYIEIQQNYKSSQGEIVELLDNLESDFLIFFESYTD